MITTSETNFSNHNAYCGWCGSKFAEQKFYPRKCFRCHNDTYINPVPVVVALIQVWDTNDEGTNPAPTLLLQKRNIEPKKGQWALPGGYMNVWETWQEAAAREVEERFGLKTVPNWYKLQTVELATNSNLLIFGLCQEIIYWNDIHFSSNEESAAIKLVRSFEDLAFPTHTAALKDWMYNDK